MPRSLRFSKAARRDLQGIRAWFRQPGAGAAAVSRLGKLEAAIAAIVAAGPSAGTRLLISQRHRVLFRIRPDTGETLTAGDIFLLRIYGPGQSDT